MGNNKTLRKAKGNKKDEFYTQYNDVANELTHYKEQYKNKNVWCPCDDFEKSQFVQFLYDVREEWGINKIMTSSYPDGKCAIIDKFGIKKLQSNGDCSFDSTDEYVQQFFNECDIITTNPPFSRFDQFVDKFVRAGKKVQVLGPWNAFFNKVIFKLYREKLLGLGYVRNKTMSFEVPDDYKGVIIDGKKYGKVAGISWWTNLDVKLEIPKYDSGCVYSKEIYPTYKNFDAIHIGSTDKIPMNYGGLMGVPGNYINVHDENTFELVGVLNGYGHSEPENGLFCGEKMEVISGSDNKVIKFSGPILDHKTIEGANRAVFGRLLIKNKNHTENHAI